MADKLKMGKERLKLHLIRSENQTKYVIMWDRPLFDPFSFRGDRGGVTLMGDPFTGECAQHL